MIIQEDKRKIETTGVTEQKNFTIAATSKAFKILSDGLYQDKILAVVRELICNAWDAHVANGSKGTPVEIHLPNMLEPWFHVKDFGTGLSHQNVMTLYTTYFGSSKTNSNDFIGALGLGSKSPFSYVESFTVESRFNGTVTNYNCLIGEEGSPNIKVLSKYEDKGVPNGLTITVPVKGDDFKKFHSSVESFIKRIPTQPKVIGVPQWKSSPISYSVEGTNWGIREGEQVGESRQSYDYAIGAYTTPENKAFAVQGLVAYPINTAAFSGLDSKEKKDLEILQRLPVDIFFPIGELEVAASREALSYDLRTQKNILARAVGIKKEIEVAVTKDIPTSGTDWDILKWYRDNYQTLSSTLSSLIGPSWVSTIESRLPLSKDFLANFTFHPEINGKYTADIYLLPKLPKIDLIFKKVTIDPLIVNRAPFLTKKEWKAKPKRYSYYSKENHFFVGEDQKIFYSSKDVEPTTQVIKNISKYILDNPGYTYLFFEEKAADLQNILKFITGVPTNDIFIDVETLPEYKVTGPSRPPKVKLTARVHGLMGIKNRGFNNYSNIWEEIADQTVIGTLLSKPFYYLEFDGHSAQGLNGRTFDGKGQLQVLINFLHAYDKKLFPLNAKGITYNPHGYIGNTSKVITDVNNCFIWRVNKEYHGYFKKEPNAINIMDYIVEQIESFIKGNHDKLYPTVATNTTRARQDLLAIMEEINKRVPVTNTEFFKVLNDLQAQIKSIEVSKNLWNTWETLKSLADFIGYDYEDFVKRNSLTEFWESTNTKAPLWTNTPVVFSPKLDWLTGLVGNNMGPATLVSLGLAINQIPS